MQKLNLMRTLMLATGIGGFVTAGLAYAQESAPPAAKVREAAKAQAAATVKPSTHSTTIQLDGGKLIVIDQDGKEREIDVGNAKSVTIQRSAQSKVVDGETIVAKVTGKAIVVGPDGVVQEIEIDGPDQGRIEVPGFKMNLRLQDELRNMQPIPGQLQNLQPGNFQQAFGSTVSMGKYFIGVQCESVNEAIRSHLGLEAGQGLIINEVTPESPAEKAGMKNHDILLYAGEKPLSEVADLVAVINEAGEGGLIVEFRLIRAGKELSVQVTPDERQGQSWAFEAIPGENFMKVELMEGEPGIFRVMPGLIRAADNEKLDMARQQIQVELEKLLGNAEEMKRGIMDESFREEMQRLREEMQNAHEEFRKAREEMLKSLQEMKRLIPPGGEGGQ